MNYIQCVPVCSSYKNLQLILDNFNLIMNSFLIYVKDWLFRCKRVFTRKAKVELDDNLMSTTYFVISWAVYM